MGEYLTLMRYLWMVMKYEFRSVYLQLLDKKNRGGSIS